MPTPPDPLRPTDGELAILSVIWDRGPSTVRGVFQRLHQTQGSGYTTVLKLMQIMVEKGLLTRDSSVRPQVFAATRPPHQTRGQMVRHLIDRVFAGSPGDAVLQALSTTKSTPEERQAIRDLLEHLESEDRESEDR